MTQKLNRYKEMERYMICGIGLDVLFFILYMIVAGAGIVWLKVILTIFTFAISGILLAFLFITKELLRPRSLWMTAAAAAILVCLLFSLILNFPCPPYVPETPAI